MQCNAMQRNKVVAGKGKSKGHALDMFWTCFLYHEIKLHQDQCFPVLKDRSLNTGEALEIDLEDRGTSFLIVVKGITELSFSE